MDKNNENLVWLDLEMTGLDSSQDQIIEIATIVTDKQLSDAVEGPVLAVFQSSEVLQAMDEWNTTQHNASGLVKRVQASKIGIAEAERQTLDFIKQYVEKGFSPMCGNSICQDRRFLARLMPELEAYFSYRNLDVSSLKEMVKRWAPEAAASFTKESTHLALDDIRDSIAELRFYREKVMNI